jgi:hypothetical protein
MKIRDRFHFNQHNRSIRRNQIRNLERDDLPALLDLVLHNMIAHHHLSISSERMRYLVLGLQECNYHCCTRCKTDTDIDAAMQEHIHLVQSGGVLTTAVVSALYLNIGVLALDRMGH